MSNHAYIIVIGKEDGTAGFVGMEDESSVLEYIYNSDDVRTIFRIDEYGHTTEVERGVRLVEKKKQKPKFTIGGTPCYGIQPIGDPVITNSSCNLGEVAEPPKKNPIAKVFVYADVVGGINEEHEKAYAFYEELVIKELAKAGYDVMTQTRKAVYNGYLVSVRDKKFVAEDRNATPSWKLALADASKSIRDMDGIEKHVVILLSGGKYDVSTEAIEGRIAHEIGVLAKYADGIMLYEYGGGVNGADMFRVVRETKYKLPDQERYKIDLAYNTTLDYVFKRDNVHLPKPVREGGKQ